MVNHNESSSKLINIFFKSLTLTLIILTLLSIFGLTSSSTSADTSVVSNVRLSVPVSCNMTSTIDTPHSATIPNGTYTTDIGQTTLKVLCNDSNGFSIYAIGYTGENYGTTTLIGRNEGATISTGTSTSGDNSAWAMKVTKVTDTSEAYLPNNLTIQNSFDSYHAVPDTYTQIASYSSSTDTTLGSKLRATYSTYVSGTQLADTYDGKVKYTLVHPYNASAPVPISRNLYYAITGSANNYTLTISDSDITSGAVASGPVAIDGYEIDEQQQWTPTTPWYSYANQIKSVVVDGTVAPTSTSAYFAGLENCESWNLSGLKTNNVTDMSYMFFDAGYNASSFTLDLSSWNTSKVTNMSHMFDLAGGYYTSSFTLNLSSWDVSSVTNMSYMFNGAGNSATAWSVSGLSDWVTSSAINMSYMFNDAGHNSTTLALDLSSWDTSNVTDMSGMFFSIGQNATTWSIGDLSGWDTSGATNMSYMFQSAGVGATTWSIGDLSGWDTSNVANMSYMFSSVGYNASSLTLDLSDWDTSSATNMSYMFSDVGYNASSLTLDLSGWDTSGVTDMTRMFASAGFNASSLTIDLSDWNTSGVTSISRMFQTTGRFATTWSVTIPKTNDGTATGPISNTTTKLYGKTTSYYASPYSGKYFTLAN